MQVADGIISPNDLRTDWTKPAIASSGLEFLGFIGKLKKIRPYNQIDAFEDGREQVCP